MDIKNVLFSLSESFGAGCVREASDKAYDILSSCCECEKKNGLTVIGKLYGKADYTLMLDAHIDEVSFIVTDVDDNGFVTVSNCGGIDLRALCARPVLIHGKKKIYGVFCSTPPHLSAGEVEYTDISALKIDSLMGKAAKDFISVGDTVTFSASPTELAGSKVTGKALDDRAGVVCLLELAERLSKKELPFNVAFVLSDMEELGMRGCKTAAYAVHPDEAVAIDVSFGDAPDVSPDECGRLSEGAMIGFAPVLCSDISNKLRNVAEENGIKYQTEVMGSRTGTDSDVIALIREGVKTGLVSIPLRNMHTDCEVIDINDIKSVCDILEKYILSGGVMNA